MTQDQLNEVSKLAHDVRNCLASAKLLTDMLTNGVAGELTAEQKDMVQSIEKSHETILELIQKYRQALSS
jgi:hypothetical protein